MRARVIVRLKEGVLDPQGQTIRRSLAKMGHPVSSVRQGKVFELEVEEPDRGRLQNLLEEISRDVLSNPIIEDFEIEDLP